MLINFIHTPPAQNSSVNYMMEVEEECVSFVNCTGSNFITNWTENNCVNNEGTTSYGSPYMAQNLRYLAFSSIGIMAIRGRLLDERVMLDETFTQQYQIRS